MRDLFCSHKTLWVGFLSFEDRCVASLSDLQGHGLQVTKGIVFDYSTRVEPSNEAESIRDNNWSIMKQYGNAVFKNGLVRNSSDPYAFQELQNNLKKIISDDEFNFVIFDITCMTKIHALALAAALAQWEYQFKWTIAYSLPENYRFLEGAYNAPGWRDVIVAPLAETAHLFNETASRGIILPGHEADRLIVALGEIESSGGLIVVSQTERRPDLQRVCERTNQKIIRQLMRMRSSVWTKEHILTNDIERLKICVNKEIKKAREKDAPVILFPYGPKPLIFFSAMELCYAYPDASWFVYPIPMGYDAGYSEGIEKTLWFTPSFEE